MRALQSLVTVTESLCEIVEKDDLALISRTLDERATLLVQCGEAAGRVKDSVIHDDDYCRQLESMGPLFAKVKQVDLKLVTLTQTKQELAAVELRQAQNQKLLLAYSV